MLDCFECYTIPSQVRGNKLMPLIMYVILEELGGMNGGGVKKGVPLYKNIISYNYNKISYTVVSIRGSHFFLFKWVASIPHNLICVPLCIV